MINIHRIKKLRHDPVSVEGECGQRTQTWRGTALYLSIALQLWIIVLRGQRKRCVTSTKPTSADKVEPSKGDDSGLGLVKTTDLSALHADQSKARSKETETDSSDHQTPTHLDIT